MMEGLSEMYKNRGDWYSLFFYGIGEPKRYLPLSVDFSEKTDLKDLEIFLTRYFNFRFRITFRVYCVVQKRKARPYRVQHKYYS